MVAAEITERCTPACMQQACGRQQSVKRTGCAGTECAHTAQYKHEHNIQTSSVQAMAVHPPAPPASHHCGQRAPDRTSVGTWPEILDDDVDFARQLSHLPDCRVRDDAPCDRQCEGIARAAALVGFLGCICPHKVRACSGRSPGHDCCLRGRDEPTLPHARHGTAGTLDVAFHRLQVS